MTNTGLSPLRCAQVEMRCFCSGEGEANALIVLRQRMDAYDSVISFSYDGGRGCLD